MATKKKAAKAKPIAKTSKKPATKSIKKSPVNKAAKVKKPVAKKSKQVIKKAAPKKAVKKVVPKKPVAKKQIVKKAAVKKAAPVKKVVAQKPQNKTESAGTKSVSAKPSSQKNIQTKTIAKPQETAPVITRPMPKPQLRKPYTGQIPQARNMNVEKTSTSTDNRSRYSDSELKEFKVIVERKLEEARAELVNLNAAVINANENGTDDTGASFKMLEDGSDSLAKEESAQLAIRQKKFVEQLEAALQRIENKTYGICRVTGKLIPKERLRAVPHTTQSMEAKMKQYRE